MLRKKQLAYSQGSKIDQIPYQSRVLIMYMQVPPRLQRGGQHLYIRFLVEPCYRMGISPRWFFSHIRSRRIPRSTAVQMHKIIRFLLFLLIILPTFLAMDFILVWAVGLISNIHSLWGFLLFIFSVGIIWLILNYTATVFLLLIFKICPFLLAGVIIVSWLIMLNMLGMLYLLWSNFNLEFGIIKTLFVYGILTLLILEFNINMFRGFKAYVREQNPEIDSLH